jgi:circadian clock protein KaiC
MKTTTAISSRKNKGTTKGNAQASLPMLEKCPTGIRGFDELTSGGLPRGRPSLVCGGPGCGKTLFSSEFLVRGAIEYGEPGVFVSFEETTDDLRKNVASLGFDLGALIEKKLLVLDHVQLERSEIEETGEYDLDGLFIRLQYAIDSIGAKRVVLDTIESLFSGLSNETILRAELRRLFGWLKQKGVTAIITAEQGQGALTRQGLEEYVSDCVILLENRVLGEISTRRMRVVKYRGSSHGNNVYPFLVDEHGLSIIPITSLGLSHDASSERISSGIPALDAMLGGQGYFRGASVLVSGEAGTGKSSIAAHFVRATCDRGERSLYFAFEESEHQILRNMKSIGVDLESARRQNLLRFHGARPSLCGLESHLATMHKLVVEFDPRVVIVDPITNLNRAGSDNEINGMLVRLIDFLKMRRVTALFTSLTEGGEAAEATGVGVSSLMDTWLLLRNLEVAGERNRGLYVLKSRGMAHSNQIREFLLTNRGIELLDVYVGPGGVLTGTARAAQEAGERAAEAARRAEIIEREVQIKRKRASVEAQIAALKAEIEADEAALVRLYDTEKARRGAMEALTTEMSKARGGNAGAVATRRRKQNGGEAKL